MCNQTGSLVGAAIERLGIPSVAIVFLRDVAAEIRPPRALWVPFDHGYALGEPNNPQLQRAVLEAALRLLGEPGPPPVLRDFDPAVAGALAVPLHASRR